MIKPLILAFQFLTILPLPQVKTEPGHFGRAMIFFPVVGLFLGGFLYTCHVMIGLGRPDSSHQVEALILLIVLAMLTRGLHLEALADFLDGFLGGRDKASTLRIMKDSRAGAFAVIGLIFIILAKLLLVADLLAAEKTGVLIIFPILSRWSMVAVCFRMKDGRENGGLAGTFLESLSPMHFVAATGLTLTFAFYFLKLSAVLYFLVCGAVVLIMRRISQKRIHGITGDVIGATGELSELFVILWCYL